MTASDRDPEAFARPSLPVLAWRTFLSDRATYRRAAPPSWRNVLASVRPSLEAPIFVLGAPRSGTTFLGECLAALPDVSYHYEPVATKLAARYVHGGDWSERRARLFYAGVYRWLLRVHGDGGRRFAEKTPQNCFVAGFLGGAFPGARFLFIVRDGRDAAVSLREKPWLRADRGGSGRREAGGHRYGAYARFWVEPGRRAEFEATTDLHRAIWSWRRHNEAALRALDELPAEASLRLRYEDVVTDPAPWGERMLDFLDVDAPRHRTAFLDALAGARTRSVGRWRDELGVDELEMIDREAGPLLRRLGYGGGGGRSGRDGSDEEAGHG